MEVERLSDIEELRGLSTKYGIAWDTGDLAMLLDVFAEDGVFDESAQGYPAAHGHAALAVCFKTFQQVLAGGTFHAATNHLYTFAGKSLAEGTVYQIGEAATDVGVIQVNNIFIDRYERIAGRWRIKSRVLKHRTPPRRIDSHPLPNPLADARTMSEGRTPEC
jgi:hypothetical protein